MKDIIKNYSLVPRYSLDIFLSKSMTLTLIFTSVKGSDYRAYQDLYHVSLKWAGTR